MQKLQVIFFIITGMLFPATDFAQTIRPIPKANSSRFIQAYYSNKINAELSKSIFRNNTGTGLMTRNAFPPLYSAFNPESGQMAIPGPGTPKSAVFCRFENTLWQRFGHAIRLRVENPQ
jgi:hypothetical protein